MSNAGKIMQNQKFENISEGVFIDTDYIDSFKQASLDTIEGVFAFSTGSELTKSTLGKHRTRIQFDIGDKTFFLKRYQNTPKTTQIKNWLSHRTKASTADFDMGPTELLKSAGIETPKTIAYGSTWKNGFETQSFVITENLYNCTSLEKQLPPCFDGSTNKYQQRCDFIKHLADFVKRFHAAGLRHRDLYLCHIFISGEGKLIMIDLQRIFKPVLLAQKYQIKDLAQLHYSSPGNRISCADRIRFYKQYAGIAKLTPEDKRFIKKIKTKAWRMADHDIKHSREVPFAK